ncbi:MAG TPA: tetratricopeptide repeat protein [Terracidiphilus sp.]|jgi:tetratricopeptide (TPR) repeat protein|nr:tetratricopeptide repeat protein [Terracidiphilus sp.]
MNRSMMSTGESRNTGFNWTCLVAVALMATSFLMAQEQDRAQIRLKAMALEQKGQNSEAEEIWGTIAKADARDAEALAHLGLLEARQEHYETAIDYYRRAVAINSDLPGLQMNLGLALFKVAQFPDAIKCFSSEIKRHPGGLRLTILLGMAHFGMKDYLIAIPYLQRATALDPQNLSLRITLAQSCLLSKEYQCVVKVQQQLLALKEESAQIDILAGEALDQMQQSVAALKQLRAAVLANPKEPNVHFGLGYLLWTQGKWEEAANELDLELQNDPQNVKTRIYLADSWVQLNEFAEALPGLENLDARDKSYPLVHRDLGIIYANSGRFEDAIRELMLAMESDPGNAELHLQAAIVYRTLGRRDQANAEIDRARKLPLPRHSSLEEMIDSIENPAP